MWPCFWKYSQLHGFSSHCRLKPNLRPAASRTRCPSGTTSLPMPSPAITAIRCLLSFAKETLQLCADQDRDFFWEVMARREGTAPHIIGHPPPCVPPREAYLDATARTPAHHQR